MAKRDANWQPDIYDMAARRAADPSPPTPHPSGSINNLTERRQKGSPAPLPLQDPADDTDLLADDEPLHDDPNADGFDEGDDPVADAAPPAGQTRSAGSAKRRPVTTLDMRSAPASDNSGLLGLVVGALVGAGLTLLVTPAAGKQVRARLQAETQQQADRGNKQVETVAQNMPNTSLSEQAAPVAGATRL